jgi:hypothetical protein
MKPACLVQRRLDWPEQDKLGMDVLPKDTTGSQYRICAVNHARRKGSFRAAAQSAMTNRALATSEKAIYSSKPGGVGS